MCVRAKGLNSQFPLGIYCKPKKKKKKKKPRRPKFFCSDLRFSSDFLFVLSPSCFFVMNIEESVV